MKDHKEIEGVWYNHKVGLINYPHFIGFRNTESPREFTTMRAYDLGYEQAKRDMENQDTAQTAWPKRVELRDDGTKITTYGHTQEEE